jgi:hypothetical protein
MRKDINRLINVLKLLFFCLCAAGANYLLAIPLWRIGAPLFMDTLFTLAVTFLAGPLWGCICAVFTTFLFYILNADGLPNTLYVLCSIGGVFLVDFFRRSYHLLEPKKGDAQSTGGGVVQSTSLRSRTEGTHTFFNTLSNIIPALFILSLSMCMLMSVSGGLIAWFITTVWSIPSHYFPYSYFLLGLRMNNMPVPLAEILARIPVNIPDRLLSVYGAYGLALVLKRFLIVPADPGGF